MMRHLPRSPAVMKLAAMLLSPLIAVHPAVGQQLFSEAEIRPLVEGLHNGTLAPATASANCKQRVEQDEGGNDIRQFMSTYLEVPEAQAVADFCDALVRAINADTVSAEGLILIAREQKDAEGFHEFGRLLRAVYFAHRLTPTAGAEEGKLR
jgi:hypothetical protein